jgi:hypothetical protein
VALQWITGGAAECVGDSGYDYAGGAGVGEAGGDSDCGCEGEAGVRAQCKRSMVRFVLVARAGTACLRKGGGEIQKNDSAWVAKHHGDEWSLLGAQAGMPVLLRATAKRKERRIRSRQERVSGDA